MTQILLETRNAVRDLLMDLIRIPSVRGQEGLAARYLCDRLQSLTDRCELIAIDDAIMQDPDYAFPLPGHTYRDTHNL